MVLSSYMILLNAVALFGLSGCTVATSKVALRQTLQEKGEGRGGITGICEYRLN